MVSAIVAIPSIAIGQQRESQFVAKIAMLYFSIILELALTVAQFHFNAQTPAPQELIVERYGSLTLIVV